MLPFLRGSGKKWIADHTQSIWLVNSCSINEKMCKKSGDLLKGWNVSSTCSGRLAKVLISFYLEDSVEYVAFFPQE